MDFFDAIYLIHKENLPITEVKVSLSCNLNDVDLTVYCTLIIHVTNPLQPKISKWDFFNFSRSNCEDFLRRIPIHAPKVRVNGLN